MAHILLADDEKGVLDTLTEVLEGAKHEVERAADGEEAYARLARRSFHMLITDLRMPRLGGMELLRRIRAEQPEVEIVVFTGYGEVKTAVEAMKLGAFDYIEKPLKCPDELRLLVERAMERRGLRNTAERVRDRPASRLTWGAPAMIAVETAVRQVARTTAKVLLTGESGTGKEVVARAIHQQSRSAGGPFVAENCAAFAEQLIESEIFGVESRVATGVERRRGLLELAEGGTFFLDEVGELTLPLQAKLLRVLQEGIFRRVGGGVRTIKADVRWIAATNRNLAAEVCAGRFREDLYFRLAEFPIQLPPLRERREDIPPLADALMGAIELERDRPGLTLDESAREALAKRDWPGNVRELMNVLKQAAIRTEGSVLRAADLDGCAHPMIRLKATDGPLSSTTDETIQGYCRQFILDRQTRGVSETEIARRLGITRPGLYKMRLRLGIPRPGDQY